MTLRKLMSNDDFTVYVVDPDVTIRDALTLALANRGYGLRQFSCRTDYLRARAPDWSGCVVANIDQPDGSGLDFLGDPAGRRISDRPLPVVLIGVGASVALVRRAFLAGAVDVLCPVVDIDALLSALDRARQITREPGAREPARRDRGSMTERLTRREVEVANLVRQGFDNHSVGDRLGISHRTVEVHKTRLMRKLGVRGLAELIALSLPKQASRTANQVSAQRSDRNT